MVFSTGLRSLSVCIKKGILSKFEAEAEEVGNKDDDGGDYGHANGADQSLPISLLALSPDIVDPSSRFVLALQHEKGRHLACSSCCSKLKRKCRICYPIPVGDGYKFICCRGLQKI